MGIMYIALHRAGVGRTTFDAKRAELQHRVAAKCSPALINCRASATEDRRVTNFGGKTI